jgi:predicted nucleic acid-binding protein
VTHQKPEHLDVNDAHQEVGQVNPGVVSILSRAELEFGITVAGPDLVAERRQRLEDLDAVFDWLPFDLGSTRAFGVVAPAVHAKAPAQARRIDTYLAGQALQHNVPLMTLNPGDFKHLLDLVTMIAPPDAQDSAR